MDMLQGKVISDSKSKDLIHTLPPPTIHFKLIGSKLSVKDSIQPKPPASLPSLTGNFHFTLP